MMPAVRAYLTRFFHQLPALVVAALVAVILIYEAPGGAADFEPVSMRPYVHPAAPGDTGVAALSTVATPAPPPARVVKT